MEPVDNDEARALELVLLKEGRLQAQHTMTKAKRFTAHFYNRRVKCKHFSVGDYVLWRRQFTEQAPLYKLTPKWEGSYKVIAELHPNAYVLWNTDGVVLPRTFGDEILKKFYY